MFSNAFFNEAIMCCVHHIKFKASIINMVFFLELFIIKFMILYLIKLYTFNIII